MNCANHPDVPVSAYCQNCGKPLCTQCVRSVAGVVYCEPCLAARLTPGPGYAAGTVPGATAGSTAAGAAASGSANWSQVPLPPGTRPGAMPGAMPSPILAGFLGAIPGVGAMYNGQFVKAFAHVIVFVILVSISDHISAVGILVAAWVFYQIFDAAQTAVARRDGRPLPDPFGLNDLGQRLGMPAAGVPYVAPPPAAGAQPDWTTPGSASYAAGEPGAQAFVQNPAQSQAAMPDPASPEFEAWARRAAAEKVMRDMGMPVTGAGYQPVAPLPPQVYVGRSEPIGAIVLIGVGMLFLLSTLGVFRLDWIGRGWPILIILIGGWLLFRRMRTTPPTGGGL